MNYQKNYKLSYQKLKKEICLICTGNFGPKGKQQFFLIILWSRDILMTVLVFVRDFLLTC